MSFRNTCVFGLCCALACIALISSAVAQATATAALSGIVSDETGAVMSHAKIKLTNSSTLIAQQVETNGSGAFAFPALAPGHYTVQASANGFRLTEVKDVVLEVGDQLSLPLRLRVGAQEDSITVQGDAAIVNDSNAVSTVVNQQFIEHEPLNGRSLQTLIGLTPGAVVIPANVVTQGQFSVNGQRDNANYFTVDGVSANFGTAFSQSLYQTAGGTVPSFSALGATSALASVDAVEEFAVQTSNVAPEYGRTPGAQVSIVTRSGANSIHGSVFDYLRNDVFDANNWFANFNGQPKPPLRQNDFGGVLGGPVRIPGLYDGRNRTFFFFSFEGLRLHQPAVTAPEEVPSIAVRQSATGSIKQILDAFPLPNRPAPDGDPSSGGFVGSYANPSTLNATSIRVDHHFDQKVGIFGRYDRAPSDLLGRALFTSANTLSQTKAFTETATVGATIVFAPKLLNDFRFNYSRSKASLIYKFDDFGGTVLPPTSLLLPPFMSATSDESFIAIGTNGGIGVGPNSINENQQVNILDSVSTLVGSHFIKFGFDYRRNLSSNHLPVNFRQLTFDNVAQVLTGTVGTVFLGNDGPTLFPMSKNFSVYGQDTWNVSQRLTLTYGLRWDVNPAPHMTNGNDLLTVQNFDPSNPASATLASPGTPLYKTTFNNFAPRFGVAYQPLRQHGTVIRGGIGIFYDLGTTFAGSPFNATNFEVLADVPLNSSVLQNPAPPIQSPDLNTPGARYVAYQPNYKLPYTVQYNTTIEQPLGGRNIATFSYVGSIGRRLERMEQNPDIQTLEFVTNSATSDYNALQVQYRRRMSRGLQALASYTWAHAMDIVSDVSIINVQAPLQSYPAARDRGPSNFDVRHAVNAALSYSPPTPSINAFASHVFGGWGFDAVINARTATPVNITAQQDFLNFSITNITRPNVVPGVPFYISDNTVPAGRRINPAAFAAPAAGQQGTLGRNALRGFDESQVDLSVRRSFHFTEAVTLEGKLDAFNVFNHPNFANPSGLLTDPNFGVATQMLAQGLGGLSSLYQIGGPRSMQLSLKVRF